MSSVRETILDAIATALNTSRPVGVPAVNRGRYVPFEQAELPAYTFYPIEGDSSPVTKHSPVVKKTMNLRFDMYGAGNIIEQVTDPIYIHIIKTMMSGSVSNLIDFVEEGKIDWEIEQGDTNVGVCHQDITIQYHTLTTDPSSNNG